MMGENNTESCTLAIFQDPPVWSYNSTGICWGSHLVQHFQASETTPYTILGHQKPLQKYYWDSYRVNSLTA